jgi:hypothetical protein
MLWIIGENLLPSALGGVAVQRDNARRRRAEETDLAPRVIALMNRKQQPFRQRTNLIPVRFVGCRQFFPQPLDLVGGFAKIISNCGIWDTLVKPIRPDAQPRHDVIAHRSSSSAESLRISRAKPTAISDVTRTISPSLVNGWTCFAISHATGAQREAYRPVRSIISARAFDCAIFTIVEAASIVSPVS